jgi:hypothetical protein
MEESQNKGIVSNGWLNENFEITGSNLPGLGWPAGGGSWLVLEFMIHNKGCWAILSNHHSGVETARINLGTFIKKKDIENLINGLKKDKQVQGKTTDYIDELRNLAKEIANGNFNQADVIAKAKELSE